ncbi:MAG: NUDIX domain-containing protein, partial [SAR324 cluster bacterium]|nr:NUDIX domain-containing protein [SAR324 cluster bacterium]
MDQDFNLTKKPVTPLVGADVFIPDSESRVLLIKRTDNGFWCTPRGGGQDLREIPEECGVREVLEETGFEITINRLLGVFSSLKYESV